MRNDLMRVAQRLPLLRDKLASAELIPQERLARWRYKFGDFWLGRSLSGDPIGWRGEPNILTCAGKGAGKSTSTVIPNLALYPGTSLVVDPKGELATITAAHRRDKLGHKVIVLDPARTARVPESLRGTFNPFDTLAADDPLAINTAQIIAESLVVPNPQAREPFWDECALDFLHGCILYMLCRYPRERLTMTELRRTVARGDRNLYEEFLRQKRDAENAERLPSSFSLLLRAMAQTSAFDGVVEESALKIEEMGQGTRGSVLSALRTHLQFLKNPLLKNVLGSSADPARTFKLEEFRDQEAPLTVYLCLPVSMVPQQGRWLRMIIALVTEYMERTAGEFHKDNHLPVLMMIDEFAQLGTIQTITNTLTYARSSGLRLWLIVHDLVQMRANYPDKWESIVAACDVKQFFGINEPFTAEYASRLTGQREIGVTSLSFGQNVQVTEGQNSLDTVGDGTAEVIGETISETNTVSTAQTQGKTSGVSDGWSLGISRQSSVSSGGSVSESASISYGAKNDGKELDVGKIVGGSVAVTGSTSNSLAISHGTIDTQSQQRSESSSVANMNGRSVANAIGSSRATSRNRLRSRATGKSRAEASGVTCTMNLSKQIRPVLREEEIRARFTNEDFQQLVHVQGHGSAILFRTPYYLDAFLKAELDGESGDE